MFLRGAADIAEAALRFEVEVDNVGHVGAYDGTDAFDQVWISRKIPWNFWKLMLFVLLFVRMNDIL